MMTGALAVAHQDHTQEKLTHADNSFPLLRIKGSDAEVSNASIPGEGPVKRIRNGKTRAQPPQAYSNHRNG